MDTRSLRCTRAQCPRIDSLVQLQMGHTAPSRMEKKGIYQKVTILNENNNNITLVSGVLFELIVKLFFTPGEAQQSYSGHSVELLSTERQKQPSSFWHGYSSSSFAASQPHPCPPNTSTHSSERYCPRVVKRKNSNVYRSEREVQISGMSAYPGQNLSVFLFKAEQMLCLSPYKCYKHSIIYKLNSSFPDFLSVDMLLK